MSDNSAQEDKKDTKKEPYQDATPHGFVTDFHLMTHQESALKWMVDREDQDLPGGILGLEQGLGKTAIVIALILEQKNKNTINGITGRSPTLIIVPKRVLYQWKAECVSRLEKSALSVLVFYGGTKENPEERDVVITTYNAVQSDKGLKSVLQGVKWTRIVLDEAHNIRDPKTKKSKAVMTLQSMYRWCLTGKLVQNLRRDIYNVVLFLGVEPFKTETTEKLGDVLKKLKETCSTLLYEEKLPSVQLEKNLVKQNVQVASLSGNERRAYEVLENAHKRFCELRKPGKVRPIYQQASIHLYGLLSKTAANSEDDEDESDNEMAEVQDVETDLEKTVAEIDAEKERIKQERTELEKVILKKVRNLRQEFPELFEIGFKNPRIDKTIEILKEILKRKEKVVVISEWKPVLEVVKNQILPWLKTLLVNVIEKDFVRYIVDDTKAVDCCKIANELNRNDYGQLPGAVSVVLMTMRAGGYGLNLHGATNVILLGRHYNPALENQAIRCVNNIAQKNKVTVYRIEISDTNEDNVKKIQDEKKAISEMARLSLGPSPLVKKEEQ